MGDVVGSGTMEDPLAWCWIEVAVGSTARVDMTVGVVLGGRVGGAVALRDFFFLFAIAMMSRF